MIKKFLIFSLLTFSLKAASLSGVMFDPLTHITKPSNLILYPNLINVDAFGADNTGVTDAASAIAAALAYAPEGSVIYFPKGTYKVSSVSVTKSNISFAGNATLLYSATAAACMFYLPDNSNTQEITFRDLVIDGNKANRVALDNCARDLGSAIYSPNGYKTITCNNVTFQNHNRNGIYAHGNVYCYNSKFLAFSLHSGNTVAPFSFSVCIQSSPVDDNVCRMNVVNCFFQSSTNLTDNWKAPGGVFVTEQSNGLGVNQMEKLLVSGCTFEGIGGVAYGNVYGAIETYNGARKVIVTDNFFSWSATGSIRVSRANDAIITGNYLEHCRHNQAGVGSTAGIEVVGYNREGSSPFTGARLNEPHNRFIITDNIVKDTQNKAISLQGHDGIISRNIVEDVSVDLLSGVLVGIGALGGDISIYDNIIKNVTTLPIYFSCLTEDTNNSHRVSINGNTILSGTNITSGNLIQVAPGSNIAGSSNRVYNLEIKNNTIIDVPFSVATAFSISKVTNAIVSGNSIKNSTNGFVIDSNSSVVVENNFQENGNVGISAAGVSYVMMRNNTFVNVTNRYALDNTVSINGMDSGSTFSGDIIPYATLTGNVGTSAKRFNSVTANEVNAGTPISGAKFTVNSSTSNNVVDIRANTAGFNSQLKNRGFSSDTTPSNLAGGSILSLDNADTTDGNYNSIQSVYNGALVSAIDFIQSNHTTHESSIDFIVRQPTSGTFNQAWRMKGDGSLVGGDLTVIGSKLAVTTAAADQDITFQTTTSGASKVTTSGYSDASLATAISPGGVMYVKNKDGTSLNYSSVAGKNNLGNVSSSIQFVNNNHTTGEGSLSFVVSEPTTGAKINPWVIKSDGTLFGGNSAWDGIASRGGRFLQGVTNISALNIDWSKADNFAKTINANSVFTFASPTSGQYIRVIVTATGANTVTWPTVIWSGNGSVPSQTSTSTDIYDFYYDGSNYIGSKRLAIATGGSGSGDVTGPASSVDNEIVLFNSTTGKIIKANSGNFISQSTTNVSLVGTYIGDSVIATNGVTITANGAASTPRFKSSGTWYSGGSATTTKPSILIEPSTATSTGWSTSGTGLGINAASGFTGNLLDAQLDGTSKFKVTSSGAGTFGSSIIAGSAGLIQAGTGGMYIASGANAVGFSTYATKYLGLLSDWQIAWKSASTGDATSTPWDTGLVRTSAGNIKITNGSSGTGDLTVANISASGNITLSTLTASTMLKADGSKNIISATAGTDYLSVLTGDVTTSGNAATLKNTGTAGTYVKTTFNAQGLETSGSTSLDLSTSDATGILAAARFPALTGDVTTSSGAVATTIANDAVTYAKMQNISATQKLLGRNTAGSGDTEEVTETQALDWLGSTQGNILYRNGSAWTVLAPGTSGQILQSGGAAANPSWTTASGTGNMVNTGASTTSKLPKYSDTSGTALAPASILGTANQVTVTVNANDWTLSLPQSYDTAATPQLGNLGLGIASVSTNRLTLATDSITTSPTDGIIMRNSTAATVGAQKYSGALSQFGQGWKTTVVAGSQEVGFRSYVVPVQGTTSPTATWTLDSSINGAAWANALTVTSAGTLTTALNITTTAGDFTIPSGHYLNLTSRGAIAGSASGVINIYNTTATAQAALLYGWLHTTKTADYTIVALDNGTYFNNIGAAGTVIFTLPTAVAGQHFGFEVDATQTLQVLAVGSDTIRFENQQTAGAGNITANVKGSYVHMFCTAANKWVIDVIKGNWASGITSPSSLTATATLDFGSILAAASADLTITVTGAAANDSVILGLPTAPDTSTTFNAFVSASDTVKVRCFNVGTIAVDPASATYRVTVLHY